MSSPTEARLLALEQEIAQLREELKQDTREIVFSLTRRECAALEAVCYHANEVGEIFNGWTSVSELDVVQTLQRLHDLLLSQIRD